MSRIGKIPIKIPKEVRVNILKSKIELKGPKGILNMQINPLISVSVADNFISVVRTVNSNRAKSLHGTTQRLISNMVKGVSVGFIKELKIVGVGYKVEVINKSLNLSLGFSHKIIFNIPDMVSAIINDKKTEITLKSIDKHLLGETAAKIRSFKPPEPYKGKGIRYFNEKVKRKEGKSSGK